MEAIEDLWHAPQQFTNDIHRGRPRQARAEEQFGKLSVGDWIEVFSNTCQVWCTGRVESIKNIDPKQKMVTVSFRTPGAAPDEISNKDLPLGSKKLRRDRRGGC